MALQLKLDQTHLGVPMDKCYVKIATLVLDNIARTLTVLCVFYSTKEARNDDITVKKLAMTAQREVLLGKSQELDAEVNSLDTALKDISDPDSDKYKRLAQARHEANERRTTNWAEYMEVDAAFQSAVGTVPFYQQTFTFPLGQLDLNNNLLEEAYARLKQVDYVSQGETFKMAADFTKAKDV